MTKARLKLLIRKLLKRIEKQAAKMARGFTGEDVHDLRLELKRLKAMLEMLGQGLPGFEPKAFFRVFKKKYGRLGAYREAEQLMAFLKSSKRLSPPRRKLAQKDLSKQLKKAEKRLKPAFFKKTVGCAKKLKKTLLDEPALFRPAAFREWMAVRSLELRAIDPTKLPGGSAPHEYRKRLKAFLYNIELADKRERAALEKSCPPPAEAEKLQETLGDLHDRAIWRRYLAGLGH